MRLFLGFFEAFEIELHAELEVVKCVGAVRLHGEEPDLTANLMREALERVKGDRHDWSQAV